MAMQRITLLGVPVDVCRPEDLEAEILEILARPGTKQIIFLSIWDLLKARSKRNDFGQCVKEADLILPVSKSILSGARFLKKEVPVRYNPFTATISILSVLDQHYKSLYLLGGRLKTLGQAERNVHQTFPNLQIVGRYVGYYQKNMENDIVQAIYKSSPSLALVSDGIREKNLWSYHRRNSFSNSIFLYYRDALGIFSDRIKRVSEKTFNKGHEIWIEIAHSPLKIFLVLPYIKYGILLVWYRLFRKDAR
ncbi:MAG: WecB/TagA/CpsF family glycosyltransferase [Treponema sp.]|nr:WecB/TagA/CpsF family glycosyltransferase [Treponema sp.]